MANGYIKPATEEGLCSTRIGTIIIAPAWQVRNALDKQADDSAIDDMKFDLSNENNSQILAWNVCHNYNKQTDEELNEIEQRLVEPTQIGFETQAEMDEKVWQDLQTTFSRWTTAAIKS